MKILLCVLMSLCVALYGYSQNNNAQQLATRIAQKMKDSLSLSETQKGNIYSINIQLSNAKSSLRQKYAAMDSLRIHTQRVENTRDSLYNTVLNHEQFILYKQKKATLISNN